MPAVIDATVGGPSANSFITHAEANQYFVERLPLSPPWVTAGQEPVLIMAARILNTLGQKVKVLVPAQNGQPAYYVIRRQLLGVPSSTTQRLIMPRIGLLNMNGVVIPGTVIPQEWKDAQAELAGQLLAEDRTLDNSVITQGIKSLSAGSVSLAFKDNITPRVIPDAVYNLMPSAWFTDEIYETALTADFEVVSDGTTPWTDRRFT